MQVVFRAALCAAIMPLLASLPAPAQAPVAGPVPPVTAPTNPTTSPVQTAPPAALPPDQTAPPVTAPASSTQTPPPVQEKPAPPPAQSTAPDTVPATSPGGTSAVPPAALPTSPPAPETPTTPIVTSTPAAVPAVPVEDVVVPDVPAAALAGAVMTILYRQAPAAMGAHNAVRVWVKGDGSGALLRLRLLETGGALPDGSGLPACPLWRSPSFPITWMGWKAILVPKSNFAVRTPKAVFTDTDMALPADAALPTVPVPAPIFAHADAVGLEVTAKKGVSLFIDDVSFVTVDASGAVQDETDVDDFEQGNVAAWVPAGGKEARQSLVYGVTTAPGAAHGGRVAFKMDIQAPNGRLAAQMAPITTILKTSGKPYLVWTPPGLFDAVLPSSLPVPGGTTSQVSVMACPDQTQAATFCLYSQKALQNVTVALPSDLIAVGHTLSRATVNVHVVKVWTRQGTGPLRDPDAAAPVPELLVKDDRVVLSGLAPAMRLAGAPVTNIAANTSKQFWVTVAVPRGTFPTRYATSLMVSAKGMTAFPVRLEVNVLPLRLLSPAKQYGIGLRSRLDPAPAVLPSLDGKDLPTDFVDKATLDAQLADISAHGFRIATVSGSPATVWDAVTEYQAYGINDSTTPFLYTGTGDPAEIEAARRERHGPPFLYYQGPPADAAAAARMAQMAKGGMAVTTYVTRQADYDTLGTGLSVPVYSVGSDYAQGLLRSRGKRVSASRDWWYWPASDEDPLANRLDTGFLLWRANLYGAFVPAYQTAFGADPYDDTSAGAAPAHAAFRPEMLTYPVQGGVLDTLQWEACREGITDTRYLTTLFAALRECKDAKVAGPLVASAEGYVKALLDKPLALLPPATLDAARPKIAAFALQLRAAVDAYNKTAPTDPNAPLVKKPSVVPGSIPVKKPVSKG